MLKKITNAVTLVKELEDKETNIFDVVAIVVYYGETLTGSCP